MTAVRAFSPGMRVGSLSCWRSSGIVPWRPERLWSSTAGRPRLYIVLLSLSTVQHLARARSLRTGVLLALSLCLSQSGKAQDDRSGRLEGRVIDSAHARPLVGARVVAVGPLPGVVLAMSWGEREVDRATLRSVNHERTASATTERTEDAVVPPVSGTAMLSGIVRGLGDALLASVNVGVFCPGKPTIVVDGFEKEWINDVSVAQIGAIAAYRAGEFTPGSHDRGCGAVLIWTKK